MSSIIIPKNDVRRKNDGTNIKVDLIRHSVCVNARYLSIL